MPYTQEQLQQLGQLNDLIASDPEAKEVLQRQLVRLGKARNLRFDFPDLAARDAAREQTEALLKEQAEKLAALEKKQQERDMLESTESKRNSLRALGASASEIEAVEKLMVEKGVYFENYEEALAWYRHKSRPLTPSGRESSSFARRYPGEKDPKEVVLSDPEMLKPRSRKFKEYMDAEYAKAFNEATAQTGGKLAFW